MEVVVFFVGPQRKITGEQSHILRYAASPSLENILDDLYYKWPELKKHLENGIVTVGGKVINQHYKFGNKDSIMIIPHIGGG
jgi:hypothetical protein